MQRSQDKSIYLQEVILGNSVGKVRQEGKNKAREYII